MPKSSSRDGALSDSPPRLGPVGWGVVLFAAAGYLTLLAPGLNWQDAGELTAAAFGLGVPHPTGFPLYVMFGKLATLFPFGSVAFRINLLSAGCATLAIAILFKTLIRVIGDDDGTTRGAVGAATLLLAGGSTWWLHSSTAEVYVPTALGLVCLFSLLVEADLTQRAKPLRMAAVLTGLGAGLHAATFAIGALALWIPVLIRRWTLDRGRLASDLGWTVWLTLSGVSVVLVLLVRAKTEPWLNWGNPADLAALWEHLSASRIRDAFSAQIGASDALGIHIDGAMGQLFEQLSWPGLMAPIGVLSLALTPGRRVWAASLLLLWLTDILYSALMNPMAIYDRQTGLHATVASVSSLAVGGALLGRLVYRRAFRTGIGGALLFVTLVALGTPAILSGGAVRDLRGLHQPQDASDAVMDVAWPYAWLMLSSDDMASACIYAQGVENRRPDATVFIKQHVADPSQVASLVARHGDGRLPEAYLEAHRSGRAAREQMATLVREIAARRPVHWELGDVVMDELVSESFLPDLPIGRLYGRRVDVPKLLYGFRSRWRELAGERWPPTALQALARRFSLLSSWFFRQGEEQYGHMTIGEAYAMNKDDPKVLNNQALALHRRGELERAAPVLRRAVRLRPDYRLGWFNLGVNAFKRGDAREAESAFSEARKLGISQTKSARATWYLAVLWANGGQRDRAREALASVLEDLPPSDRAAARKMLKALEAL